MARPLSFVQIDIAEFLWVVSRIPKTELGTWTEQLAECLATRNVATHVYGGKLLREAEETRKAETERKRKYSDSQRQSKRGKTVNPRIQTDQIRSDQTDQSKKENAKTPLYSPTQNSNGSAPINGSGHEEGKAPDGAKKPRKRNPVFDSLTEVFGFSVVTPADGKRLGKVTAELSAKGATPEAIAAAYATAEKLWDAPFGPEALAKNWDLLQRSAKNGTSNGHAGNAGKSRQRAGEYPEHLPL